MNNPKVREYFINICAEWIKKFDIDGIRLDVANELSHVFNRELRLKLRELKSDFFIVGEIWHNALPWLRGDEFDSVMNYPLQNAISDFCIDNKMNVKEFEWAVNRCFSSYYSQVNKVLFNQMDTHDTERIFNRCGKNKSKALQALVLLFLMPGSVCLYYGTEILLEGDHDPDNRRCMPWKEIDEGMFDETLDFVKKLIELRKSSGAMISEDMKFLYSCRQFEHHDCSASKFVDSDFDSYGNSRVLRLEKKSKDGERLLLILNCSDECVNVCEEGKVLLSNGYENGLIERDGLVLFNQEL